MMKAVRLYEFGGPDKLIYGEHPMPEVGPGDVLVKVLATSVSRWDVKYRTGEVHEFYGKSTGHHGGIHGRRAFPMPMQLGRDVAGGWRRRRAGHHAQAGDRARHDQSGEHALAASIRAPAICRAASIFRATHVRRLCAVHSRPESLDQGQPALDLDQALPPCGQPPPTASSPTD
jgi:hypothetical protein